MLRKWATRRAVLLLSLCCAVFCIWILFAQVAVIFPDSEAQALLASTPPMGWNSWDAYGETVSESDIKANAAWMAEHLKSYGWQYIVVDSGWYVTNHSAGTNAVAAEFSLDAYGRYTPAVNDSCPWNPFNYGLKAGSPAAQAYYNSIAKLYADWGVDFLKVDCISSHPYKGDEIRMISLALRKIRRPIVLSLSPGPAPLDKAIELRRYAQMWSISDDVWDVWYSDKNFPQGVGNQFARAAKWAAFSSPGHWPDADMLPLGRLEPAAGWEKPRTTRLTHDEQRTLLTLWSIFRSPLIMGGNLTLCDEWTESALTNAELIGVDQHSTGSHAVVSTDKAAVWVSTPESGDGAYIAVFNLGAASQSFHYIWRDLGLKRANYNLRDLWEHEDLGFKEAIHVTLPAHGSAIYWASEK